MFDSEFYPTDQKVFDLMEANCINRTVYDPQAGSGNLLTFAKNSGAKKLYASERNPDLALISKAKADRFLGSNFFDIKAENVVGVDLFLMNPPFSNAERHIVHAWDICDEGTEIISLFNYNSMQYGYGDKERTRALAKNYGFIRNLGPVFADNQERKTDVNIGLIKLYKPVTTSNMDFEGFYMDEEVFVEEGLIPSSAIDLLVGNYKAAVQAFEKVYEAGRTLSTFTKDIGSVDIKVSVQHEDDTRSPTEFLVALQRNAWRKVFGMMKLERFVTSQVMKDINRFAEEQRNVPFSKRNIFKMMEIIVGTSDQILEKALVSAVDNFTKYTHENRFGVEGWKTNAGHLLNPKFIVNHMVEPSWTRGYTLTYHYERYQKIDDLTKVLCNLTGKPYNKIGSIYHYFQNCGYDRSKLVKANYTTKYNKGDIVINPKSDIVISTCDDNPINSTKWEKPFIDRNTWYTWGFFEFKVFKKGTMHLKFRDKDEWAILNRAYAKAKGQVLPEEL